MILTVPVAEDVLEKVREAVAESVINFPENVPLALDQAYTSVCALPNYEELVETLVRNCIKQMIYDARREANGGIKRDMRVAGGVAAPSPGNSASVAELSKELFNLFIAGKTLGSLTGKELLLVGAKERASGKGHLVNAELCEQLAKIVPEDKSVRDSVNVKKLSEIYQKARLKIMGEEKAVPPVSKIRKRKMPELL